VPAFESNGIYLNESDAIAQYVSNEALLGGSNIDKALVREYISFSENQVVPSACTWVFPTLGFKQYNKQDTEAAINQLKVCLLKLNKDLLTKTFLVGERVTLADITLCTSLVMLYVQVLDPNFRKSYENVNRWFVTCINQPLFKKVLGEIKLCETMATFDTKRFQEIHPKGGKAKKESKPKEEKKPKAVAKVEPKPAATEAAPKKIDYFADVPKSAFVLDQWKKHYKNNSDIDVVTKYLEENFDFNAYSIWHCEMVNSDADKEDYKLPFMATNSVGGYLQRIEGLRKHTFGIMATFEESEPFKNYSISGLWIVRGLKNVFRLNPDWNVDAEFYKFTKLDLKNDADKNVIYKYLDGLDAAGRDCDSFETFV